MLTAYKSYIKNLHKVSLPVVYKMPGVLSTETVDKCRQSSRNSLFSEYRMTKHLKCCNKLSEYFTYRMERLIKWPLTNTKGTPLPKNIPILLSWSLQYVLITLRWEFSATKYFGGVDWIGSRFYLSVAQETVERTCLGLKMWYIYCCLWLKKINPLLELVNQN